MITTCTAGQGYWGLDEYLEQLPTLIDWVCFGWPYWLGWLAIKRNIRDIEIFKETLFASSMLHQAAEEEAQPEDLEYSYLTEVCIPYKSALDLQDVFCTVIHDHPMHVKYNVVLGHRVGVSWRILVRKPLWPRTSYSLQLTRNNLDTSRPKTLLPRLLSL